MKPGDSRCTPEEVLEVVRNFGTIALDPCGNPFSTVDAVTTFDLQAELEIDRKLWERGKRYKADGLDTPWRPFVTANSQEFAWVNHPWSTPVPWAEKCRDEWYRSRVESLMWGPYYAEAEWFQVWWDHCSRICFWHRRVHHPNPDETKKSGSMWGTALGYFGDRIEDFERVFRPYGRIVPAGRELRRLCG